MQTVDSRAGLRQRQMELIEANLKPLRQALAMLDSIDERVFAEPLPSLGNLKVSSQLRHVVEYYECFLTQAGSGHVDYDVRKRDASLEKSKSAMARRIAETIHMIETLQLLRGDCLLFVRMEDAGVGRWQDPFLMSSVGRELQTLSAHTIHHLALVSAILQAWRVPVAPEVGVAPSTLRYQATGAAA